MKDWIQNNKPLFNTKIVDIINPPKNSWDFGGGHFGGGGWGTSFTTEKEKPFIDKWLDHRYPIGPSFDQAFGNARKKGLLEFVFDGKKYNTSLGTKWNKEWASRPEAVFRFVTDENNDVVDDSTRVEPFLGIPPVLEINNPNVKKKQAGGLLTPKQINIAPKLWTDSLQFMQKPAFKSDVMLTKKKSYLDEYNNLNAQRDSISKLLLAPNLGKLEINSLKGKQIKLDQLLQDLYEYQGRKTGK